MKSIYLIAPYSADSSTVISANVQQVIAAATIIIELSDDFYPDCTHALSWMIQPHLRKVISEVYWRSGGIEKLRQSDCALVIGQPQKILESVGSQGEIQFCKDNGKPIIFCGIPIDVLTIGKSLDSLRELLVD